MTRPVNTRRDIPGRQPSTNAPIVQVRRTDVVYEAVNPLAKSFSALVGPLYGHHLETIQLRFGYRVEILP